MSRPRRPSRSLAIAAAVLLSGGLSACGKHLDEQSRTVQIENEGLYLPLGELKYQVQGSRQLNPDTIQDRALLLGVPVQQKELEDNEVWFGVFLQVENQGSKPLRPSADIEIVDTQEDVFRPLGLEDTNPFAYRSTDPIPGGRLMPLRDTPAFDTANQGALLLFKLTLDALDNRPLELKIQSSTTDQTGIIDLDI
ncbi:MAG: hypothetical protein QOG42_1377 [Solirubrobacteraceae bacterium]|nr:hypothetical protein [Solirubrobacteraceae bacterium]